eukprot:m51a1_g718 putative tata-binding protein-associated factor 172 (1668) ;mRNA; r:443039-448869
MSRLDRLLSLLETGSNDAVRRAAAVQIGEIQRLQPGQLHHLLGRVRPRLFHRAWETRVAAACTIEHICRAVSPWSPAPEPADPAAAAAAGAPARPAPQSLASFNVAQVVSTDRPLLAADVAKHAAPAAPAAASPGTPTKAPARPMYDISSPPAKRAKTADAECAAAAAAAAPVVSARQAAAAKRKAKLVAGASSAAAAAAAPMPMEVAEARTKLVATEQPQQKDKIVVEAVRDEAALLSPSGRWPFEALCDSLCTELLNPAWEARHGAALGLREVLRFHASGAGMQNGMTDDEKKAGNAAEIEGIVVQLLTVLARDRFADFVSDQAVAPVRETCAQALGVACKQCSNASVHRVVDVLLFLQSQEAWEARLAGFLGLKYVVAVRSDMERELLPMILPAVLAGMRDKVDDVRGASAAALLPVASAVSRLREVVSEEQTTAVLSVLWDALSDLDDLTASTAPIMELLAELHESVVPVSSLKVSGLAPGRHPFVVLLPRLVRYIHHNISAVKVAAFRTLARLLAQDSSPTAWAPDVLPSLLVHLFVSIVIDKAMSEKALIAWEAAISVPTELLRELATKVIPTALGFLRGLRNDESLARMASEGDDPTDVLESVKVDDVAAAQALLHAGGSAPLLAGCKALAGIAYRWPVAYAADWTDIVEQYISCSAGIAKLIGVYILEEWGLRQGQSPAPVAQTVFDMAASFIGQKSPLFETDILLNREAMQDLLPLRLLLPPGAQWPERFTMDLARTLIASTAEKNDVLARRAAATLLVVSELDDSTHTRFESSLAASLVHWRRLPVKIAPAVNALTASLKQEKDDVLQARSACALAAVVASRGPKVAPRLIKMMVDMLMSNDNSDAAALPRRGAEASFVYLARDESLGEHLFEKLPDILTIIAEPLAEAAPFHTTLMPPLHLLRVILPAVHKSLQPKLMEMLPRAIVFAASTVEVVQNAVAKLVAIACHTNPTVAMRHVVQHLLPLMSPHASICQKRGAIKSIHEVVSSMDVAIVPFATFLLGPLLGCMSDQDQGVRESVAYSFGSLVRLLPLEAGMAVPEGLSPEMIAMRDKERHFLQQFLDGRKLDAYPLQFSINGDLRKYQQEGINWMCFLRKYHLHGILCDDMGLGKTLQALCAVAAGTFDQNESPEACMAPGGGFPSLVVCPPTLVGHWKAEVGHFIEDKIMNPIMYVGSKAERDRILKSLTKKDVLIVSYEVLRKDVEALCTVRFNYCVLDEGHIIKNAKTKMTKAVKLIRANNRLILTGTPIQNNVLELWSLFDFLMPGYLGTEKQFNDNYSKPILASRNSTQPKDQEAGALAMEALHRQVQPFLLRRLKSDVLQDLPPKIIQDFYIDLSPLQARLYEDFRSRQDILEEVKKEASESSSSAHVFQALQYMRKVCDHPALVLNPEHPQYGPVMADLARDNSKLNDINHSSKLTALRDLLHQCGIGLEQQEEIAPEQQHRVLVFAQMKTMLDFVENDLLKVHMPKVTYLRLDGSTPASSRHELVCRFNADPTIDLLLLTTHVGGLGLNLTGADVVIFLEHDWNPTKDLQAMDRAHRLGQKKVVNVYRLITRGTLEEKIMGLQSFKTKLANTVVARETDSLSTVDTSQLLDLFSASASATAPQQQHPTQEESQETKGLGKKLAAVLNQVGELWDESQYSEEFDVSKFIQQNQK